MNEILKRTHKTEYIDLLKVRDYYFDAARRCNRIRNLLMCLPPFILAITYLPSLSRVGWIASGRDYLVGAVSIALFILIHYGIEKAINDNLFISNAFREKYDCSVFGIEENPFAYPLENMDQYMSKARFVNDYYKYEVWYGEIFCDSNARNVICCQMDNIIYTYYVYQDYKKLLLFVPAGILLVSLATLLFGFEVFLLVFVSLFNIFQVYVESKDNVDELIKTNRGIMEKIKRTQAETLEALDARDLSVIRKLQDVILNNRNHSLFVPKFIRMKHLREDSVYYLDLNQYKSMFLDQDSVTIPSAADELEVLNLDEEGSISLKQIQQRLLEMMQKVQEVFEEEHIVYALDGGTLIGAVRNSDIRNPSPQVHTTGGGFVFWDDDIDIAIPVMGGMLNRAKKVIRERLGDEFDIQDYENDPYYSPRLSNFRIRDKRSVISEKDSPLYDRYQYRGLFIDVYAYSPVLYSISLDKLYRRVFIHPLYRRLKKTEFRYPKYSRFGETRDKKVLDRLLKKFEQQKICYMRRVNWYQAHAKNENYFVLMPNYIDNLKRPGPYLEKKDLYGEQKSVQFESLEMPVPSRPERVLEAFYGKWFISPYSSVDMLKEEYGESWYSHCEFAVSVMKHIDHVNLNGGQGDPNTGPSAERTQWSG